MLNYIASHYRALIAFENYLSNIQYHYWSLAYSCSLECRPLRSCWFHNLFKTHPFTKFHMYNLPDWKRSGPWQKLHLGCDQMTRVKSSTHSEVWYGKDGYEFLEYLTKYCCLLLLHYKDDCSDLSCDIWFSLFMCSYLLLRISLKNLKGMEFFLLFNSSFFSLLWSAAKIWHPLILAQLLSYEFDATAFAITALIDWFLLLAINLEL
jgi:hypothetical protein